MNLEKKCTIKITLTGVEAVGLKKELNMLLGKIEPMGFDSTPVSLKLVDLLQKIEDRGIQ